MVNIVVAGEELENKQTKKKEVEPHDKQTEKKKEQKNE